MKSCLESHPRPVMHQRIFSTELGDNALFPLNWELVTNHSVDGQSSLQVPFWRNEEKIDESFSF